ncbi:WD repeat-containing protein 26 homolog [Lucilia sericata]|uniref:WD repeat-containing protein 26 homolog n=1 Tax=Lucilia sericata TaxID=13632 RepID=UPI0018A7EFD0|nr:WD repeat-containing protein 26 homolog [Lucilia sericata]XP_037817993.1 WD repeat-containing protein 26 homolog [Lucilia sericata]XP_037817994.1 WD repeat-containing protein 26 homolog [Lucilia sericata]XP_037817995.1 WD repeat-containing protein 26 homolog [Lucilia sericata]XP_037817996.1 WD repeat-containing protein 26 homolog [Lucilia sericata]XP_037817997.1 WD repeat-containing protein 26 homolog [Lucilia sericata]XP_037817998.1 WD repeat-containing protein 26 homolog [Lucilia sericat
MQNSALNPSTSSSSSASSFSASTVESGAMPNSAPAAGSSSSSSSHAATDSSAAAAASSSVNNSTSTNGHDSKHNGFTANQNNNNNSSTEAPNNCDDQNNHNEVANKTISWLGKSNEEIIRLIGQYLQDLGLKKSVKTLMNESGCYLEHPSATKFREHVLSGEWSKADADLKELEPLIDNGKPSTITEMKFILLEQKYLENLDDNCHLDALHVLRNELTPLQHNISRVHQLSSYMMCSNSQDLHQRTKWEGKGILSRSLVMERLQTFLPPSVMMAPRRLRALLQQAVELQTQNCLFHDMAWETNLQNVSLLTDHCCATDGFPLQTIQILSDHCDEVWFCKFSPDGLKLATGSKDGAVIIWDVDPYKLQLKQRRSLDCQSQVSVAFISWSPDSKLVLIVGSEDSTEVCIFNVDDGRLLMKMNNMNQESDSLSCGAFNRDGTRFVCGGQKGQFHLCDLKGTVLESWEGVRINSVAFRSDNKTILAADNHYRIRGYNFDNPRTDFDVLKESHPIMTFSVNSADRLALLNVSSQGLHLWDIEDKCIVRSFQGIRQSNFAIHSCFGGVNESFVASGSEDKHVCIWHIKREEPLAKLAGHAKTVNCVSWNPVYPSLLASASDDSTVRIWGPTAPHNLNATPESDDCSSCSSSSSWNMTS